ncbi:CrcB family protein [Staphylococcus sp. SQ8-PEA]|uniref:Fluoride-specific ion channel FluC n=1 Tax=Staphylococcus marylandisciuri TaxID=2981529 RepID=A0ABT2QS82_9STAP|nr:CrcB family protein [Staphylococcus marylandisciuri]MCU5746830.1 CrcB family protein [Staphylococcus marylandisciuri]
MTILYILLGGGLGALLRSIATELSNRFINTSYPIATPLVNIAGSFLISFVSGISLYHQWLSPFFTIGLLGGLTTFSTLSWEIVNIYDNNRHLMTVIIYSFIQYIGAFLACLLGYYLS